MSEKFRRIVGLLMRQDVPFHLEKSNEETYLAVSDGKTYWIIGDKEEGMSDVYFFSQADDYRLFEDELSYVVMAMKYSW